MQFRTKLIVGIATVTTVAFALSRRGNRSQDTEQSLDSTAVAESDSESVVL